MPAKELKCTWQTRGSFLSAGASSQTTANCVSQVLIPRSITLKTLVQSLPPRLSQYLWLKHTEFTSKWFVLFLVCCHFKMPSLLEANTFGSSSEAIRLSTLTYNVLNLSENISHCFCSNACLQAGCRGLWLFSENRATGRMFFMQAESSVGNRTD